MLQTSFADSRARNPGVSLRAFARRIGFSPSVLSQLFAGKRGFTVQLAERALEKLNGRTEIKRGILEGIASGAARRGRPRKPPREVYAFSPPRRQALRYLELSSDEFRLVSDWHGFAIASLAETRAFREDPAWIAERLGIRKRDAERALNSLVRTGLLVRASGGKLRASGRKFQTSTDVPDTFVRAHHFQGLELARAALEALPVEERDFGAATIAADPDRLAEAKVRIREFRKEITEFLETGEKREVFRFHTQLFPITKRKAGGA